MRAFRKLLPFAALSLVTFLFAPYWMRLVQFATPMEAYQQAWFLLLLPAFVPLIYWLTYRAAKKTWNTARQLQEEREYAFDEVGMQIRADSFEGRLEWTNFTYAECYQGLVLIQNGQRQFHFFPVSRLPAPQEFFDLVSRKVPKTRRLTEK